jgi:hypothetical protein
MDTLVPSFDQDLSITSPLKWAFKFAAVYESGVEAPRILNPTSVTVRVSL